jgi:CubicO group peptidase (beta-lactamase class C family)
VTEIHGFTVPGFEPVADVLAGGARVTVAGRERATDLGSGGGAFAAYVDGACVVDLWAGDSAPGIPWSEDTRAVIMSATKGLATLCAHLLVDRGALDVEAPVVSYWPEFGAGGKQSTLVRHVLSHQSGAIGLPHREDILSWDGTGWQDTQAIVTDLASSSPAWEPGTRHGYHGVTYGWLVGELVRCTSGLDLGTFFRSQVAEPLGVACAIGTPDGDLGRVATVIEWTPRSSSGRTALGAIDPDSWAGRSVLAGADGNLFTDVEGRPRFASFMNQPAVLSAGPGSIGATATARGLARVYAELASGDELVSRSSVDRFSTEQVNGRDAVMGVPTRWALGYTREPSAVVAGLPRQHGPNDEAFGHMGAGGQIGFADPMAGVGCAFVRNHLESQSLPLMGATLVDTFYRCLGSAP